MIGVLVIIALAHIWIIVIRQDYIDNLEADINYYQNKLSNMEKETNNLQSNLNTCNEEYAKCQENVVNLTNIKCEYNPVAYCPYSIPTFIDIAQQVASSHEYKANEFDCTEFSETLYDELYKAGWESKLKTGYYYEDGETCTGFNKEEFNCRHDWLCLTNVCIEATAGTVIDPEDYKLRYEER